ncbi:MAG: dihydroneopterin aldolase [Gammaproteobacteria bacterium]|nr:MAG: dihydroneopterin aldolase [Gammaproteobacteria bacterium]
MDIVFIRNLRVDTIIGIYDWERQVKQTLVFDVEMATDIRKASATDNIEFALNYHAVSQRIIAYGESHHALLVETLAENVAALIRSEFHVPWLRLTLTKPNAVLGANAVGIIVERGVKPTLGKIE